MFIVFSPASAGHVSVTASPLTFSPSLTPTLSIRCDVNDTDDSGVSTPHSSQISPVHHVTSIMLTRGGEGGDVASVSKFSGAQVLNSTLNVTARGEVGDAIGNRG